MAIGRPYFRTVRPFADGEYVGWYPKGTQTWRTEYMAHPHYAREPRRFVRSFLLLQEDIRRLFDFLEPAADNAEAYSLRTFELLLRACVEVEANLGAILRENRYARSSAKLTMGDYRLVDHSHFLSQYRVWIPEWSGDGDVRQPFAAWESGASLQWYQDHHKVKHDRVGTFHLASLGNLVDAWCGLAVLVTAQFLDEDFSGNHAAITVPGLAAREPFKPCLGSYLHVQRPAATPPQDRYDFNWTEISQEAQPFQAFDYRTVSGD